MERRGHVIYNDNVKQTLSILKILGNCSYENIFELSFCENSFEYYLKESQSIVGTLDVPLLLNTINKIIKGEHERGDKYYSKSTMIKIENIINTTLIIPNIKYILEVKQIIVKLFRIEMDFRLC